jgi:hypothetical protein
MYVICVWPMEKNQRSGCGVVGQLGQGRVSLNIGARLAPRHAGSTQVRAAPSHTDERVDRSGTGGDRSGMPPGSIGDRLAYRGDGPMGHIGCNI